MELAHGLYYVNRGAAEAFVLSTEDLPPLGPVDVAVLLSLLDLAIGQAGRAARSYCLDATTGPAAAGGHPNPLGLPLGVYYVPTGGGPAYPLTAEEPPALPRAEAAVAEGLATHADGRLNKTEPLV